MTDRYGSLCATILLLTAGFVGLPRPSMAASEQAIEASIRSGALYLMNLARDEKTFKNGEESLILYAMLKSKVDKESPEVKRMVKEVLRHFATDGYGNGLSNEAATYAAGLDALSLVELDPEKYRKELIQVRDFLVSRQYDFGGYDYRGYRPGSLGTDEADISVSQYAMLGLWAVSRVGIEVPDGTWHRAAGFFAKAQQKDGGWSYRVRPSNGRAIRGGTTLNMTAAGVGSLLITALYIKEQREEVKAATPSKSDRTEQAAKARAVDPDLPPVRYGVLFPVTADEADDGEPKKVDPEVVPEAIAERIETDFRVSPEQIRQKSAPGLAYLDREFEVFPSTPRFKSYYYYALERAATLGDREQLGGVDWYDACSTQLLKSQQADGGWHLGEGKPQDTSFVLLFLSRSTQQLVGKKKPSLFGGGLLMGGRGLPEDLKDYGKVKPDERRIETPLEKLLSDLSTADATELPKLQEKFVEEVQIGDHQALIGQSDRLIELSENDSAAIRRIAVWAMGRTGELALARHVLPLLDDPSPAVLTETRNALAWIARRPDAYGLAEFPPADENELQKWRSEAWMKWGQWYLDQSLYGERLDEFELNLRRRLDGIRGYQ